MFINKHTLYVVNIFSKKPITTRENLIYYFNVEDIESKLELDGEKI